MKKIVLGLALSTLAASFMASSFLIADEFNSDDVDKWQKEFDTVANRGRELWVSPNLGSNQVACAQCHPNATNTHPETYPKFQKQLGKVAGMWEMINWCIRNPLEGEELFADDPDMVALLAYTHKERKGVELAPGKH